MITYMERWQRNLKLKTEVFILTPQDIILSQPFFSYFFINGLVLLIICTKWQIIKVKHPLLDIYMKKHHYEDEK